MSTLIPSILPNPIGSASNIPVTHSCFPICSSNNTHIAVEYPSRKTYILSCSQYTLHMPSRLSWDLSHNIVGPKEQLLDWYIPIRFYPHILTTNILQKRKRKRKRLCANQYHHLWWELCKLFWRVEILKS